VTRHRRRYRRWRLCRQKRSWIRRGEALGVGCRRESIDAACRLRWPHYHDGVGGTASRWKGIGIVRLRRRQIGSRLGDGSPVKVHQPGLGATGLIVRPREAVGPPKSAGMGYGTWQGRGLTKRSRGGLLCIDSPSRRPWSMLGEVGDAGRCPVEQGVCKV
jgi:hypothetical protein